MDYFREVKMPGVELKAILRGETLESIFVRRSNYIKIEYVKDIDANSF